MIPAKKSVVHKTIHKDETGKIGNRHFYCVKVKVKLAMSITLKYTPVKVMACMLLKLVQQEVLSQDS